MANVSPDADALVEEGLALYSQGHLDQALSKWRAALLQEPTLALALEYIKYVEENRAALEATFYGEQGGGAEETKEDAPRAEDAPEDAPEDPQEPVEEAKDVPEEAEDAPGTPKDTPGAPKGAEETPSTDDTACEPPPRIDADDPLPADDAPDDAPSPGDAAPPSERSEAEPQAPLKRAGSARLPTGPIRPLAAPLPPTFGQDPDDQSAREQVDVLEEVSWDDLINEPSPPDPDLTPRIDVETLDEQVSQRRDPSGPMPKFAGTSAPEPAPAQEDLTLPREALSRPAERARRATPLTLQPRPRGQDVFGVDDATPGSPSAAESAPARPPQSLGAPSTAELVAEQSTPGRLGAKVGTKEKGRPTSQHFTSKRGADGAPGLTPEEVFSPVEDEELVADDATPASMIKRGHGGAPGAGSRPHSPPRIPPNIPVAVPPPLPRASKQQRRLELRAEEGFVGLDDLLTSDEEAALEAAEGALTAPLAQAKAAASPMAGLADLLEPEDPAELGALGAEPLSVDSLSSGPAQTGPALEPLPAKEPAAGLEELALEGLAEEAARYEEPAPAEPAEGEERLESMLSGAQQLYDQGTFEGSLWLCEKILSIDAEEPKARQLLRRNQQVLLRQYERQLADLAAIPIVQIPQQEIVWHKLDHRAGFLLSRVDGMLSYDDILDISGMERFEACRILAQLVEQGVIGANR